MCADIIWHAKNMRVSKGAPADAPAGLDKGDGQPFCEQITGGGQTGGPGPDHHDIGTG